MLAVRSQTERTDQFEDREFGQINVTRQSAIDLLEGLRFIESSLDEKNRQLALEVAEELVVSNQSSASLLLKIFLMELTNTLKQKKWSSLPYLLINNLKVRLLMRLKSKPASRTSETNVYFN